MKSLKHTFSSSLSCFLLILLSHTLHAQCSEFDRLMAEGNSYANKAKYEQAVNAYTTAMLVCPDKSQLAANQIQVVFKKVETLKRQAENDKKRAELNEQKAKIQAIISKTLVMASTARDWAKEGLYMKALALLEAAYNTAKINNAHPRASYACLYLL